VAPKPLCAYPIPVVYRHAITANQLCRTDIGEWPRARTHQRRIDIEIEVRVMSSADIQVFLIVALIVFPALGYIFWGRPYRRRMILGYFTPASIADYFDQFWAGRDHYGSLTAKYRKALKAAPDSPETAAAGERLCDEMFDLYNRRFGWRSYFVPLVLLAAVLYIEASIVWSYASYWLDRTAAETKSLELAQETAALFTQLPDKVIVAALSGAYLSVGLNLFSRIASLSLLPSDLNYYSLRMTVAPAMGFALSAVAGSVNAIVLVSFAITLLPISDILTWLRSLAAKSLNITDSPQDGTDKLINLPGVDSDLAARLQEQGITTIRQFADTDPVQLSMRSGLDFAFVVSLVDEALAWPYFGKRLVALSAFGWSGVSDIVDTAMSLASDPSTERAALDFVATQTALNDAIEKVAAATPSDVDYAQLLKTKADAEQAICIAKLGLVANSGSSNFKLIETIAGEADLNLTEVGLRNTVIRIGADRYARFIRRLRQEIQPIAAVDAAQPSDAGGLLAKAKGIALEVGRNVKSITRTIGES
jgi:hypothetical protein